MPSYKFTYFNGRGRGQNARIMFKLAGVEFEDHRIEFAEWPEFKPKTPFGSMPILTVDGKELTQAKAIGRYLAREFDLYGKTNIEAAEIDCVMDMCEDVYEKAPAVMGAGGDADKLAAALAEYKTGATQMFTNLEKKLNECNDGKEFFLGKRMTAADVFAFSAMDFATSICGGDDSVLADFPKLKALRSRIGENKKVAAWVASRPTTPF